MLLHLFWLASRTPRQVTDTAAAYGLRVRAAARRPPQPLARRAATTAAAVLALATPAAMLAPAAQASHGSPAAWAGPARVSSAQQWDGHLKVAARAAARVEAAQAAVLSRALAGAAEVPAALAAERQAELDREAAAQAAAAAAEAAAAAQAQAPAPAQPPPAPAVSQPVPAQGPGVLSPGQVGSLWLQAGGPSWAEGAAESVAMCESGDNTGATNPSSGAAGLFQILGQVVPGNLYDPFVNALNAVSKFRASGDTWAQWTCQP